MGDLKIIMIIVSRIQTLVKLIIRCGMKHFVIYPSRIIAVDHFTHQPEILFPLTGAVTHFFHKIKRQTVSTVQTDTVNVKLRDPEMNHIKQIITDCLLVKI